MIAGSLQSRQSGCVELQINSAQYAQNGCPICLSFIWFLWLIRLLWFNQTNETD
jgi:hypothetical protein